MAVSERHIVKEAPSLAELGELAALAPGGVRDLVAKNSARYRELHLAAVAMSDEEWLDLLAREPKLLRRPLVTDGQRLVIGHRPEALSELAR